MDKNRHAVEADEIAFFDHYYSTHAYNEYGWRLRLQRERRTILRLAGQPKLGNVLSLGCGDGEFEVMLAPFAQRVVGLDISGEAIALARAKASAAGVTNVDFLCSPLAEMRWESEYDAVICLSFLHHIPAADLPSLVRDIFVSLRSRGWLYTHDPNVRGLLRSVGRLVLGRSYDRYHSPDERELDPDEVVGLLRASGFTQTKVGHIDSTLIPALFILKRGPNWPLALCRALDWVWCHSPLASQASAFYTFSRKA